MRSALRGLLAAVVVVAAGCSSDDGTSTATAPSSAAPSPAVAPADSSLVEDYVQAVADRDLVAANALRCEGVQIDPESSTVFGDQVGRLVTANGDLALSRLQVAVSPPHFDLVESMQDAVVLEVWLKFGKAEADPLFLFVGDERGQRRLCGWGVPGIEDRYAAAHDGAVGDSGQTRRTIDELLAIPVPTGFTEAVPAAAPAQGEPDPVGLQKFRVRSFTPDTYGGITISVARFDTAAHAKARADQRLREALGSSTQVEALSQPDAPAVFVGSYNFTFLQPPSAKPSLVQVVLLYGDTVVYVAQSEVDPAAQTAPWRDVLQAVARVAEA